jgi:DNA-3-methyladenine glycosylase
MRANVLRRLFYEKSTLKVAQDLLGCFLVRKFAGRRRQKIIKGIITETEAYIGEKDLACHASRGRTPRTEVMYGEAGRAYVYLIYGMYHCLNVVTEKKNFPAAVLIRSVKPLVTIRANSYPRGKNADSKNGNILLDGPGKVCRFYKIDKKLNGWDLTRGEKLWIARPRRKKHRVRVSKRIGIEYAKHCQHYMWRFFMKTD